MSRRYFSTIHLRVNAPTQRGEAGAPLLNMKGECWIVVSGLENNSACYAVPIEAAEKFVATLFVSVRPTRLDRGEQCFARIAASRRLASDGNQVAEDAPAARSG